jgi:nucleotide-binding universal stress UspA family protein
MSATTQQHSTPRHERDSVFGRILVGIDDTAESLEAARQAGTLATGSVSLLAAYDLTAAVAGAGMAPAPVHLDETPVRERAEEALERARQELVPIEAAGKIAKGRAWQLLLDEIARERVTLVVVGSHNPSRAKGILIGSTATELLHKAPCSVLVAQRPLKDFPSSIVVGVDDSPQGSTADAVAGDLAHRFGAKLERLENVRHPVDALAEAALGADLLVVGSRGLRGLESLGSVSERVAHEARCSVLVVR